VPPLLEKEGKSRSLPSCPRRGGCEADGVVGACLRRGWLRI
jgi:hypothetical protein